MGDVNDDDEGETDEGEQLIPGRYEEKVLAQGVVPTTRGWMIDAWLTGKPATVRFVTAELGDDGLMHVRASSDEMDDDGPRASGKNYLEALDALEKKLAEKLLS